MNSLRTVDGFLACTRGAEAQYEVWTRVVELVSQSPLYPLYPNVDWLRLFTKLGDLLRHDYDWSKEAAAIKALAMTVFADADAVPDDPHHGAFRASQRRSAR